jgi:transposase
VLGLASISVKVHPDGTGAQKKVHSPSARAEADGTPRFIMVAADARTAITFALSPGNAHDASAGRELLRDLGPMPEGLPLLMDGAYEGDETRQLVLSLGMIPVVPPKPNRIEPWVYDHALYKKRNEIEGLFRRLKGFRRIFSRFEKLDVLFLAFINFALMGNSRSVGLEVLRGANARTAFKWRLCCVSEWFTAIVAIQCVFAVYFHPMLWFR